jgi:hypothetical protein
VHALRRFADGTPPCHALRMVAARFPHAFNGPAGRSSSHAAAGAPPDSRTPRRRASKCTRPQPASSRGAALCAPRPRCGPPISPARPTHFPRPLPHELPVIVKASSGPRYVVGCRNKVDRSKLTAGTRVALDMTTLTIMRMLPREVRCPRGGGLQGRTLAARERRRPRQRRLLLRAAGEAPGGGCSYKPRGSRPSSCSRSNRLGGRAEAVRSCSGSAAAPRAATLAPDPAPAPAPVPRGRGPSPGRPNGVQHAAGARTGGLALNSGAARSGPGAPGHANSEAPGARARAPGGVGRKPWRRASPQRLDPPRPRRAPPPPPGRRRTPARWTTAASAACPSRSASCARA